MIYLLTVTGSKSCNKVIDYFAHKETSIEIEKITKDTKLSPNLVKQLLTCSIDGFSEIISKRSLAYKKIERKIPSMTTKDLITYIANNPTMLKYPIVIKNDKLFVGIKSLGIEEIESN